MLQRLLRGSLSDIADRGRQELYKSFDRLGTSAQLAAPGAQPMASREAGHGAARRSRAVGAREVDAALGRLRMQGAAHFFAGCENSALGPMLEPALAAELRRVTELADRACAGRLALLGFADLSIGSPIDWHRDPVTGRCAPRVHWSRIDALDAPSLGDSKFIWELNRHQWFLHLGQAYRLTGDERYAAAWTDAVKSWLAANPPQIGINWASSLELAYRLIAWCWSVHLFRLSPRLTDSLFAEILDSSARQARHIERYLSRHYSPNTHLTGEALGLLYVSLVFPDLRAAARWRRLSQRILLQQLRRQVLADGVYFEQSTCYQQYTVETYLHWLILAQRNGIAVPAYVGDAVQGMVDFLVALRRPDGTMPQIGDGDGGRLLPLVRRSSQDFRALFATAAALFRRPDYAWAAGGPAPEVLWLLGPTGQSILEDMVPAPPHQTSRIFERGGYAVMRDHWGPDGQQLIFDVGPLGCPVSGGHGHADLLGIQCSVRGEAHLIDPGTYCYTLDPQWRDYFRGTAAHSTVTVDGLAQAVPAGPFSWRRRPHARLHRWHSSEEFELADAEHGAYRRLADPVVHRRRILFSRGRYWLVIDDLSGQEAHAVRLHFQFATASVNREPQGWVRSHGAKGALLVRTFAPQAQSLDLTIRGTQPCRGWRSPDYGVLVGAATLTVAVTTRLPLRVVTLLLAAEPVEAPPDVEAQFTVDRFELRWTASGETVTVDAQALRVERPGRPPWLIP